MQLIDLIAALEAQDPRKVLPLGFTDPHSYRGNYYDLAFEPAGDVTVADCLEAAKAALNTTYQGYKGGDFTMKHYTECYLAHYGQTGDELSELLLSLLLADGYIPSTSAEPEQDATQKEIAELREAGKALVDELDRFQQQHVEEVAQLKLQLEQAQVPEYLVVRQLVEEPELDPPTDEARAEAWQAWPATGRREATRMLALALYMEADKWERRKNPMRAEFAREDARRVMTWKDHDFVKPQPGLEFRIHKVEDVS